METIPKPPHRIFSFPELVGLVCTFSASATCASMLQVSRLFFDAAAPIAWESVVGVPRLLKLIEGFIEERTLPYPYFFDGFERARDSKVSFTSDLKESSFSRFDHYARFVKQLEIYSSKRRFTLRNWHRIVVAAKDKTLLPNLQRLTMNDPDAATHFQCVWIRTFMSPSLTTIQVLGNPSKVPFIDSLAASVLVRQITSTCPNLHTLSLFPTHTAPRVPRDYDEDEDEMSYIALKMWESPRSYFAAFSSLALRDLACTSAILAPDNIQFLGHFQTLERLEVRCVTGESELIQIASPTDIDPESLPQLRHFALHSAPPDVVFQILKLGMFSSLSSLRLIISDTLLEEDSEGTWGATLMNGISLSSPALNELDFAVGSHLHFMITSTTTLEPLAVLPLRNVRLQVYAMDDLVLTDLGNVFPLVTRMDLSDMDMPLTSVDLIHFAKLPNLEHLRVNLLFNTFRTSDLDNPVSVGSTRFRTLQCSSAGIQVDLQPLARYLLSFWPNLQRFDLTDGANSYGPQHNGIHGDQIVANALNTIIAMQRTINNTI